MPNTNFNEYILERATTAKASCKIEKMKKVIFDGLNNAPDTFKIKLKERIYNKLKPNTIISPIQNFKYPVCLIYMNTIQEIAIEEMQVDLEYKVSANFVNRYMTPKKSQQYNLSDELRAGLSVQSMLDVVGYSLDIAEQLDMPVENLKSGVVGLKVINRVFSEQTNDDFSVKDLGLAVEVIATAAKYFTDDTATKKYIGLTSSIFNIAIDLLTKL